MQKLYALLFLAFFVLFGVPLKAQDIHFSQFYASPLTLNPALTGIMQGDYRISGIYRNQWASVSTPYVTYAASYDMRVLQNKLKNDVFGVGLLLMDDRSGDGKMGDLSITANAAFHKRLGARKRNFLGIGVQVGYVQRSLDYASLTFPDQHTITGFDPSIATGENLRSTKIGYADLNAGVLWNGQITQKVGLFDGVSIFHLTNPTESFLGQDVHLAMRYVLHGGLRIQLAKRVYLTPNYIFMYQDGANEFNIGTGVEYVLGDGVKQAILGLGLWYRVADAPIVSATVEYMKIRVGVSYDFTTTGLQSIPGLQGSFELSLVYQGAFSKGIGPIMVPCPRL